MGNGHCYKFSQPNKQALDGMLRNQLKKLVRK